MKTTSGFGIHSSDPRNTVDKSLWYPCFLITRHSAPGRPRIQRVILNSPYRVQEIYFSPWERLNRRSYFCSMKADAVCTDPLLKPTRKQNLRPEQPINFVLSSRWSKALARSWISSVVACILNCECVNLNSERLFVSSYLRSFEGHTVYTGNNGKHDGRRPLPELGEGGNPLPAGGSTNLCLEPLVFFFFF